MLSHSEFLATLPRKRIGAGALIRDRQGRVLLVEPTYRQGWILPGGTVEADESPSAGVARELVEELGVGQSVGRLLAMEWVRRADDQDGALQLVYDGGVVDDAAIASFRLPADELASFRFVEPDALAGLIAPSSPRRVLAALEAARAGTVAEVER